MDPPAPVVLMENIDCQIAIGDLGCHLRRREDAYRNFRPYLKADPSLTAQLKERYIVSAGGRLRVGISWRTAADRDGMARSLGLAVLGRHVQ